MIWHDGMIRPAEELTIRCTDRTFEHGIGLFETFRTWNGRARPLRRHLERLTRSAAELGLPPVVSRLPDEGDVGRLLAAEGLEDGLVRLTMTGGSADSSEPVIWMRATALAPIDPPAWSVRSTWRLPERGGLADHKTLNYWRNRRLHEAALRDGFQEDVLRNETGGFLEGTRTNLFAIRDDVLHTAHADGWILPGVMRGLVLERSREIGLPVERGSEPTLPFYFRDADEIFLTNSGRGVIPVRRFVADPWEWNGPVPGPWTDRLDASVRRWLESEERP